MNFFKKRVWFLNFGFVRHWLAMAKCSSETQKLECQFAMATLNFAWQNSQEPENFIHFNLLWIYSFLIIFPMNCMEFVVVFFQAWHLRIHLRDQPLQEERRNKPKSHQPLDLMMSTYSSVRGIWTDIKNYAGRRFGMTNSSKFQLKGSIGFLLQSFKGENGRYWLPLTPTSTLRLCMSSMRTPCL